MMMARRVFLQALEKGAGFSFVFFLFFMMTSIPIVLLLIGSLTKGNLPGLALALVFAAVIAKDLYRRRLFETCRDMAVLNLTLWFLLGFFSLVQGLNADLPSYLSYLLLAPYAILSGFLVHYLLSRAESDHRRVLLGGVIVSTMIAVISAINGAIISAMHDVTAQTQQLVDANGATAFLPDVVPSFSNPHLSFLLVLILFNIPFINRYVRKSDEKRGLWWYLLPLAVYAVLMLTWQYIKPLLLG